MRTALAGLLVLGLAATASANGRDPYTSTINFQRTNDQHIVAGMTFGLVESKDGGATWNWMCEKAVGYGGQYDPDYVFSSTGALFATTFDGLKVRRDGCTFAATPPGMTFVSKVEQGPNGTIYYAAADQNDGKIYKSTDDGATFPTSANPGMPGDWWSSIMVAPSNPNRIYLSGYRFVKRCMGGANAGQSCMDDTNCPGSMCEQQKDLLLFTSNNGGTSYTPMNLNMITPVSANSVIEVVGVSPLDDQTVFIKVTFVNGGDGDSIYKSTNAGTNWTKILSKNSIFGLSFLVRKTGTNTIQCIAGTRELGAWKSDTCDATPWPQLAGAPHIGCLYADSANNVWACTQNYATPPNVMPNISSDDYGIMKSSDLTTWTGVLKYQDIKAPVPCAGGTVQEDECVQKYMGQQSQWCCLVPQLGITSTAIDCAGALACFGDTVDGAPDGGTTMVKPPGDGCCGTGSGRSSALLSLLVGAVLLLRRRTPKEA